MESGAGSASRVAPPGDPKALLRREILAARTRLRTDEVVAANRAVTSLVLQLPEIRAARRVASYVSVGREPATRELLDALCARGVRVLAPVLLPDNDLDWAVYEGVSALAPAARGLDEPLGKRLGTGAIATCDVVVVPALAVDRAGNRLGRGGGSYDRALARVPPEATLLAVLYEAELLPEPERVPIDAWDRPVHAVVRPSGVHRVESR